MKTTIVTEGQTKLEVLKASLENPFHLDVFYNPFMRLNRSLSVLAVQATLPLVGGGKMVDGLCSLGARGLRYAMEAKGVENVLFVDANPSAAKLAKKNFKHNKIKKSVKLSFAENDLNKALLESRECFDFIEIDPFGTPVFYLENAVRRCNKKAILSITATDLANLHGSKPSPCLRTYDAKPLHCMFGHENALRILLGKIARTAAMQDYAITPLLSFYHRHYAKTMVLLEKGSLKADASLKQIGFTIFCPSCFHAETKKIPLETCPKCGKKAGFTGPLWIGKTCSEKTLQEILKENENRELEDKPQIEKMVKLLLQENEEGMPSWFFDLDQVASKNKAASTTKIDNAIARLQQAGFKATRTHFSPTGVKTNANAQEVFKAIK